MKKNHARPAMQDDDLLPEYDLDFSRAKPNPYAARLSGNVRTVVLDPDVAEAFPDAESVNMALRRLIPKPREVVTS